MFGIGKLGSLGTVGNPFGWVLPNASIDMNFAAGTYYGQTPSNLTVTRALTSYSNNTAGQWISFSSNTPRITDKGLLVEESRTNSIRNNSMQGAVAGTPGTVPTNWSIAAAAGLTSTIVGVGTENGLDYIEWTFTGTSSAAAVRIYQETATGISANNSTNANWAQSVFYRFTATPTNTLSVATSAIGYSSVPAQTGESFLSTADTSLSQTWTRVTGAHTWTNAATASARPGIDINITNGVSVSFTIRIGWPQYEAGTFSTSPIRTTSAAVTRPEDVVSFTSNIALGSAFSLYGDYTCIGANSSLNQSVLRGRVDASNTMSIFGISTGGNTVAQTTSNGGASASGQVSHGAASVNTAYKTAMGFSLNSLRSARNGSLGTEDTSADIPVGIASTPMGVGGNAGISGSPLNGYIRRAAIWQTTAITDGTLQSITT